MKRGKDEENVMGPMFPRLHVNDTEKGGPRAPPRNKMALYEQLSIPSQRFNHNSSNNLVPPASSSQGSGHERGTFLPLQLPPTEKPHSGYADLNPVIVQREQNKQTEEDDFSVPIFVHSEVSQDRSKNCNSINKEGVSLLSPAYSAHSMKLHKTSEKDSKQMDTTVMNLRQEGRRQLDENPKEFEAGQKQSCKSISIRSSRDNAEGPLNKTTISSNYERSIPSPNDFRRLQYTDDSLQLENAAESQLDNTVWDDSIRNNPIRRIAYGNSFISSRDIQPEGHRSPNGLNNMSLPTGNVDRGDDLSETSMVDSVCGMDLSPDDVVGIIGQKHFWKARRAIVNQQRVFAVQVFELHRLIKVQRFIAGSPNILLEENAYLGKPLKRAPSKKLPLEYIVKATPNVPKHTDDSERPSLEMEGSAENVIGKVSLSSSVQNGSQPSNNRPFIGTQPPTAGTTDNGKMGSWSYSQPPGQHWLIPVMSPSEGLVYKPYPGPGFVGPVCGGFGPPGPTPDMNNFLNYGVPPHHQYPGLGVDPFVPPGRGYFPPYAMPVMSPAMSGSAGEHVNRFPGPGQLPGVGVNFNMLNQSSCNGPNQKNSAVSNVVKFSASKDCELQVSTASSPSERAQGTRPTDGRNALSLFPMSPSRDGGPLSRDIIQPAQVIKVVPHNARSATASVARIFQSIQEERKQYDSI